MPSLKQLLIDAKNTALRPYYQIRIWRPVWDLLNAESRSLFSQSDRALTKAQEDVIKQLSENGVAVMHLDDLFPGQQMLAQMQERAKSLEASATPNPKKTFLTQLVSLYTTLDLTDVFIRFSFSQEVLQCIAGYLQQWPKFYYYTLGITQPVDQGEAPRQSQRWHRDPEDRKMCKVFVYLTDVDETSGPFMYVRRSTKDLKWGNVYPQRPPHGRYPPEGEVERLIPQEEIKICTGRAGTVIFADTSGLHKGGYATQRSRMMSTSGFVTKACPRGVFYVRPENFSEISKELNPMALYALKNTKVANRKWKY